MQGVPGTDSRGKSGIVHVESLESSRFSLDESVDLMMQAEEMEEVNVNGSVSFSKGTTKLEKASFSLEKIALTEEEEVQEVEAGFRVILRLHLEREGLLTEYPYRGL